MLYFNRFTRFHIPRNPIKSQSRLSNPVICVGFKPPSQPAVFSHQQLLQSRGTLQPVAALRGPNRSICSPNAAVETGWTVPKFWFRTWLKHWREKKRAVIQRGNASLNFTTVTFSAQKPFFLSIFCEVLTMDVPVLLLQGSAQPPFLCVLAVKVNPMQSFLQNSLSNADTEE